MNPPEEIIAAAVKLKMPAVALTDTNGMYAAVPFYQAARAAGVKPIVGVTLDVEFSQTTSSAAIPRLRADKNGRFSAPFGSAEGRRNDSSASMPMVLLAADAAGYSNLCQLTTLRHLGVLRPGQETFAEDVGRPVPLEELAAHSTGVIALWPAAEILRGGVAQAGRASPAPTKAMRIGLMQVKGLRVETIVAIVRAREAEGAFCSLEDFLARVPAERDEIEALIKCGAFDEVCGMTRAAMLWQWNLLQAGGRGKAFPQGLKPLSSHGSMSELKLRPPKEEEKVRSTEIGRTQERAGRARPLQEVRTVGVLFAEMEAEDALGAALREIDAPNYTREQKLRYEREVLEVCVSGHPLDFLPRNGETWSDELQGMVGKRVTLCGWVVTYRHVGTKNCRNMMFVTLEDQRGLFEVILFPDVYDKYGGLVYETRSMRVTGVVMEGEHVNGERWRS